MPLPIASEISLFTSPETLVSGSSQGWGEGRIRAIETANSQNAARFPAGRSLNYCVRLSVNHAEFLAACPGVRSPEATASRAFASPDW